MKTIVAIGASNSTNSINRQLAFWAASQVEESQIELLDLNDYEMPIYSVDRENSTGIPQQALDFKQRINEADGIVISLAEYNGSYTSAFKNITDWVSRIEGGTWSNKPLFLLATSPGPRGGMGVLASAKMTFPYQGGIVAGSMSLPSFHQNFDSKVGITDAELLSNFKIELNNFTESISNEQYDQASA